jgi:vesicular inhibitory amino acid transporter
LRIIEQDRRLRNFTDVIGFALGKRGEKIVTVLFLIEVCAWV